MCLPSLCFKDLRGKRVVITGEVGSGKTRLLAKLIDEATLEPNSNVCVLDLAPNLRINTKIVGASVAAYCRSLPQVKYLRPSTIFAPRLQGRSREEVLDMAARNAAAITPLLVSLTSNPSDVLFVDDLTIYLQAGDLDLITKLILKVGTFIATAYKGEAVSDDKCSGLSGKEKTTLKALLSDPKLRILEVALGASI